MIYDYLTIYCHATNFYFDFSINIFQTCFVYYCRIQENDLRSFYQSLLYINNFV